MGGGRAARLRAPARPAGSGAGAERDDSASWRSVALSAPGPARDPPGYRSHCRVGLVKQSCRAGRRVSAVSGHGETMNKQPRASGSTMARSSQVGSREEKKLALCGFPPPGHPYWTADTIVGAAQCYSQSGPHRLTDMNRAAAR